MASPLDPASRMSLPGCRQSCEPLRQSTALVAATPQRDDAGTPATEVAQVNEMLETGEMAEFLPGVKASEAAATLQRILLTIDVDGSGTLSQREMQYMWRLCFPDEPLSDATIERIAKMFNDIDDDKSEVVECDELIAYVELGLREQRRVELSKPKNVKAWVWTVVGSDEVPFLTAGSDTLLSLSVIVPKIFCQVVVVVSMITLAVESMAQMQTEDVTAQDGTGPAGNLSTHVIEAVCMGFFTIEFALYLAACPRKHKLLKMQDFWIHLGSVLPFYMELLTGSAGIGRIQIMRVLRLLRLFRILRLTTMSGNKGNRVPSLSTALRFAKEPLWTFLTMFVILVSVSGCLVTFFERQEARFDFERQLWVGKDSDVTLLIQNIPDGIYWAIVTATTTGYGDKYPITSGGRIVAVTTMLGTIIVLAFPINILGHVFTEVQGEENEERQRRNVCSQFTSGLQALITDAINGEHSCECGYILLSDALFCRECGRQTGKPTASTCLGCGNALGQDSQFCLRCGRAARKDVGAKQDGGNTPIKDAGWFEAGKSQMMDKVQRKPKGGAPGKKKEQKEYRVQSGDVGTDASLRELLLLVRHQSQAIGEVQEALAELHAEQQAQRRDIDALRGDLRDLPPPHARIPNGGPAASPATSAAPDGAAAAVTPATPAAPAPAAAHRASPPPHTAARRRRRRQSEPEDQPADAAARSAADAAGKPQ